MYQHNPQLITSTDEESTVAATLCWIDPPEHLDLEGILDAIYNRNGYLRQRLIRVGDLFELVIKSTAVCEGEFMLPSKGRGPPQEVADPSRRSHVHSFRFWRAEYEKDAYDKDDCRECWFYCYRGPGKRVTAIPHVTFGGKSFTATVRFITTFDEIGLM
jgi:hypothetical protein